MTRTEAIVRADSPSPAGPTFRLLRRHEPTRAGAGYRGTMEVIDEATSESFAKCHLPGRAAQSVLEIRAANGHRWTSTPNRSVMPTAWDLADGGSLAFRLEARIAGKLVNPLHRTSLTVLSRSGGELFTLVDPRTGIGDRVLGSGPRDWVLLAGDHPCARLTLLPARETRGPGVRGWLKRLLARADPAFVSLGSAHVLPPAVVLALIAIHRELTDPS